MLSGRLLGYVLDQKKNIIVSNFKDSSSVVLAFNDLIRMEVKNISIQTPL
ncbi:MAG: hypothetical protein WCJ39_05680 [bacterium]